MKHVIVYTDGACKGNPGPGGWAAIIMFNMNEKIISGFDPCTTNNRMELTAAIEGLCALKEPCNVSLYTDSKYLKDGFTEWMHTWVRKNWKTSTGSIVSNQDLWLKLYNLYHQHTINIVWVKGHAGDPLNEKADHFANQAILNIPPSSKVKS